MSKIRCKSYQLSIGLDQTSSETGLFINDYSVQVGTTLTEPSAKTSNGSSDFLLAGHTYKCFTQLSVGAFFEVNVRENQQFLATLNLPSNTVEMLKKAFWDCFDLQKGGLFTNEMKGKFHAFAEIVNSDKGLFDNFQDLSTKKQREIFTFIFDGIKKNEVDLNLFKDNLEAATATVNFVGLQVAKEKLKFFKDYRSY